MGIHLVLLLSTTVFVTLKGSRVLSTLFAVDLGAGPLETGILFAMNGLFPFLLSVHAGRIADRFDNRMLMYVGIAGVSICMLLPFLFPVLPVLYGAVAVGGFSSMLFVVATQNLVGALSPPEQRTRNFSLYRLGESIATVAGPVFVGFAIDAFRHPLTYLCLAVYTAAWGIVLYACRHRIPHAGRANPAPGQQSMMDLLKLPALRKALLTNGIVMTGMDLFSLYMPVYAHGLGLSASAIGMIVGAFGCAGFVTRLAIPMATKRLGERGLLAIALSLSALAFVSFPLTTSPALLAAAAFALGLGLGCGQPLTMILAFNASPPGRSAEGIAMRLAVSYGTHVFLPPAFGAIGSVFGLAPIFWTCAVLLGGGALLNRRMPADRGENEG
jgi:predicted MFS family arabinose efflux permease